MAFVSCLAFFYGDTLISAAIKRTNDTRPELEEPHVKAFDVDEMFYVCEI